MNTYSIFIQKYDCEVWIDLKIGTLESIPTIRELITYELDANPSLESGYVESYPFFQADWEIVGGRFEPGFDFNQILEVPSHWRAL